MYYCGLKIGEDTSTVTIVDDKAKLFGKSLSFKTDMLELEVFLETLCDLGVDKSNLVMGMEFEFVTAYKKAYDFYRYLKSEGWNIHFINPGALKDKILVVTGPWALGDNSLRTAMCLQRHNNEKNFFVDDDEFKTEIVMAKVRFFYLYFCGFSIFWAISVLNIFSGIKINKTDGVIYIFLLVFATGLLTTAVYQLIKEYKRYHVKLPYCILDKEGVQILESSNKKYKKKILWKNINKTEKKVTYDINNTKYNVVLFEDCGMEEIKEKETCSNIDTLWNLVNFYWVNFSGRDKDEKQLA